SNYFIGFCEDKGEIRQFKLVRIKSLQLLKDKFDKPDFDLKKYLGQTIGIFKDKSYNIKLKIDYPYAQGFKEYCWVDSEEVEDHINEGFIIYRATVEGKAQVIPWIMGMGTACEVLEPLDLKEEVIAAFKEILEKYK
ncbi:WYL domain-containing protein, partial [Clostridium saudiense]|nr:WYL domain-containing protein [Clostridium saudiense]